jgi:hypothetical protein
MNRGRLSRWDKMLDDAEKRGKLIRQLEDALALTEELNDP